MFAVILASVSSVLLRLCYVFEGLSVFMGMMVVFATEMLSTGIGILRRSISCRRSLFPSLRSVIC